MTRNTKLGALLAGALVLIGALALSGCGVGDQRRDLEGVVVKNPQKYELYANIDTHPNIARLCIDGVAFVTTSRDYSAVLRVPEWDTWCKS